MNRFLPSALLVGGAVAAAVYAATLRRGRGFRYVDKRVAIMGGSRGLGLIMARHLVDEGAHVALLARDGAELERARDDLKRRDAQHVVTHVCDVRDRTSVQTAVDDVVHELGGIDVLINCAGIIGVGPVQHMDVSDFEDAMATHFWGPLYASLAALPYMRRQGSGRILNIASLGGKITIPHLGPYSTSKAALVALSEVLRNELAGAGISVTCACPSVMRTGAHVNARFKGRHRQEFTIFALVASLPLISNDATAAARTILEACRRGEAAVYIPSLFRLSPALNALFPTAVSNALALLNRILPHPTDGAGDLSKEGWDCQTPLAPSALTYLGDVATAENNELRGHAPLVDTPQDLPARPVPYAANDDATDGQDATGQRLTLNGNGRVY